MNYLDARREAVEMTDRQMNICGFYDVNSDRKCFGQKHPEIKPHCWVTREQLEAEETGLSLYYAAKVRENEAAIREKLSGS